MLPKRKSTDEAAPRPNRRTTMLKRMKIWLLLAAPLLVAPLIPGCPLIP
jgi:hypothetical protein